MEPIHSLSKLVSHLQKQHIKKKIAVACGQDSNTIQAIGRASDAGLVEIRLYGNLQTILAVCKRYGINDELFTVIHCETDTDALNQALASVKSGESDILMKGLIQTDLFLKAILHKEKGLMKPGAVLSYVCAIELPEHPRLLFISDPAVLVSPDLKQKESMIRYALGMASNFGIHTPKVALISSTEKPGEGLPHTIDYTTLCKMVDRQQIKNCIIDGPIDIFSACHPEAAAIKGIPGPIQGDADILIFPNIESCNSFYKGLMVFGKGELAGILQGTEKPVVMMSRSESELSKYYCLALACLSAQNNK